MQYALGCLDATEWSDLSQIFFDGPFADFPLVALFLHPIAQMQLGFAMLFEACRETGLANGAPIFIDLGRIRWAGFLFADILGSLVDRDWPVAQTLPHLVTVVLSH